MVKLFGSEKQKKAFSAAKRNLVEAGALESALTTALSQAEKEMEEAASGVCTCVYMCVYTCVYMCVHVCIYMCVHVYVVCVCFYSFILDSTQQNSGLMPPHNSSAESPQDVYNLEDSILKQIGCYS